MGFAGFMSEIEDEQERERQDANLLRLVRLATRLQREGRLEELDRPVQRMGHPTIPRE